MSEDLKVRITRLQREVMAAVNPTKDVWPRADEVASRIGMSSACARTHLYALERKGIVERWQPMPSLIRWKIVSNVKGVTP